MNSINFVNPWLLFIALPLLAAVIVPFVITVRRDNANFHNIASVSLHVIICICITLAIAGLSFETVITETQVYVLADISYSSEHNTDEVQKNVELISGKLPRNSKMGVICFGRNYQLLSDLGEKVPDVTKADKVDRTATDICAALRYAGNLFDENVIKRIIVITDGAETVASNNVIKVVGSLQDSGVYVDAVYLDDNIAPQTREVQIDGVEATSSTYLNKTEEVSVLVRANCGVDDSGNAVDMCRGFVDLYNGKEHAARKTATFYNGLNVVNIPLNTDEVGHFEYEVRVTTDNPNHDSSPYNNNGLFAQTVTDERKVLFIGASASDVAAGRNIYGDNDVTYITDVAQIPLTVEKMCGYDEIVLSNFDVRTLKSSTMFLTSLSTLVNTYGKTLTTYGNTYIQEIYGDDNLTANTALRQYQELLPVNIGNNNQDKRLVAIVLDISISMNFEGRFVVAKRAAVELLKALNKNDDVMVIAFSGGVTEMLPPTPLTSPGIIIDRINKCEAENETNLSAALKYTRDLMPKRYHNKQVIVISDGLNPIADNERAITLAHEMSQEKITVSALGIYPKPDGNALLTTMVHNESAQEGAFYKSIKHESEVDVVIQDISEETKEVLIEGDTYNLTIERSSEDVVEGVENIGAINGFWYNSAKSSAKTVLTAKYYRDRVESFDVPIYAYWTPGGKGKVVSFLSDITSDWTDLWQSTDGGQKFLSNIPDATLPDERIVSPFVIDVQGSGSSTTISVTTSNSLQNSTVFDVTITDPNGMVTTKPLAFDSSTYVANFATDAPGRYTVQLNYKHNELEYKIQSYFSVSYYAEYDAFATYSQSYLYRLLTEKGQILNLEEIKMLDNSESSYTTYVLDFTMPLMIISAALFLADIVIRQLKWKDVTSFFSGIFRRRNEK